MDESGGFSVVVRGLIWFSRDDSSELINSGVKKNMAGKSLNLVRRCLTGHTVLLTDT